MQKYFHLKNLQNGFHLIELLVTVAIIGIVASLCLPLYTQYIVQARRSDATATLAKLSVAMEEFYVEHNSYADATLSQLNFPEKISKNYRVAIKNATHNNYLLIAKPTGRQARNDKKCGSLMLDANEKKQITGNGNVNDCW